MPARAKGEVNRDMTTEAQVVANRLNGKKSTGPRTPAGKSVVRFNALRHGLLSRECLVIGDDETDFLRFARRLLADLAPVGALELLLADRIVSTVWRLRRAVSLERWVLDGVNEHKTSGRTALADALSWRSDQDRLQLFSRYEAQLERSLYRALHELQRLQAARDGQSVSPPEVADVDVCVTVADVPD